MLIKNAKIYGQEQADVRIEGETIAQIAPNLSPKNDEEVLYANDLSLLPSFIDLNVNLKNDTFSLENLELLQNECLKSGISSIMLRDKMNFDTQSFALFLQALKHNLIEIFPSINVLDDEKKIKNLATLINKGAKALELQSSLDANSLRMSMQYALMKKIPIFSFCFEAHFDDNGVMNDSPTSFELGLVGISEVGELSEVAKMKQIAEFYGVELVYDKLSLASSLHLLDAKDKTQVSIHHLLKSDEACKGFNSFAKLMPPLRSKENACALKQALKAGKISFLSADHSPKSITFKDLAFNEAAFGIHSICEYISLCYTFLVKEGFMSWEELCDYTSFNQAQFLGLNSGKIAVGKLANLVLFDEKTSFYPVKTSLYANDKLFGELKAHIIKGKVLFKADN
ncbi:metal-dependent hydrolase [Campylobacter sp. MIT 19-121]|uniref:metal-dependent hydrolase n=1 Tax=Campylobacter sp. MIT 19-121 TaxID=2703906 RepID=UPI00138942BA|nr:metal-dependent hydrolase [Campylobacter sp. MIT 19-121]NDJ26481.1 metal-dependent hydrolase [Campylobacter sp. MIT 19-121]